MTSANKPQSLREKAEETWTEISKNWVNGLQPIDAIESAFREAVLEERKRCANLIQEWDNERNDGLHRGEYYLVTLILKGTEGEK